MGSFVSNLNEVAAKLNIIEAANGIFDEGVIPVLTEISQLNLVEVTNDLKKGNYLGGRKLDIDLSQYKNADGSAMYYEQVNIVTVDGVTKEWPFYAAGTTTISETSSPSIILQHIRDAIDDYNSNEPDPFKHIVYTEFDLLNEVDVTKPTVIRLRDTDGHSSTVLRIELLQYSSHIIQRHTWIDTTSALQTLSDKISTIIDVGREINNITNVSSKIDELLILEGSIDELVTDNGSVYNKLNELLTLYAELAKLLTVYEDIKTGGTNYTNTVGLDLQNVESKIKKVADDLYAGANSVLTTIVTNLSKLNSIYAKIANGDLPKIADIVDDGSVGKLVSKIDDGAFNKLVGRLDDGSFDKIIAKIDDSSVSKIVTAIDNGQISTIAGNITDLQNIANNMTEILKADDNAALATAQAAIATNQANIATEKANSIHTLGAEALTLAAGSNASVHYDSNDNKLVIGVPQGPAGPRGDSFTVDATGTSAERDGYDGQPKGFSFLATDVGELYIKQSDTSGDWSPGIPFGKGDKGDPGVGIAAVTFTATTDPSGQPHKLNAIDTYAITYDDGTTTNFSVANGFGRTVIKCVSDYTASASNLCLCDTKAIQQVDKIKDIVAANGTEYKVKINTSELVYLSDEYVNQTDTIDNITVADDTDYTIDIDIGGDTTNLSYHSDAAVAQVDIVKNITVADDTDYSIDINGTTLTYHSDAAVQQVNTLDDVVVANDTDYSISINDTDVVYHSQEAVAQVDEITNITVANNQTYAFTVEGNEVSYTSGDEATADDIVNGLIDAVNNDDTVSDIVTAATCTDGLSLTAVTAGDPFSTSITSGSMDLATVVENDNATEAEILNGLKDAINATTEPVTADSISNGIKVTADTAGVGFTIAVNSGNITNTIVTDNDNATLDEILNGLRDAVNGSSEPIDTSINSTEGTLSLIAHTAGVAFTSSAVTGNLEIVNSVPNDNATIGEIVTGLVDAVNDADIDVTATGKGTYLIIAANSHDGTFTTTVSSNMEVSSVAANDATLDEVVNGIAGAINGGSEPVTAAVNADNTITVSADTTGVGYSISILSGQMALESVAANQEGITTLKLPASPEYGDTVEVRDIAGSFEDKNLTIDGNGLLIRGESSLDLDINDMDIEFVYSGIDWRYE